MELRVWARMRLGWENEGTGSLSVSEDRTWGLRKEEDARLTLGLRPDQPHVSSFSGHSGPSTSPSVWAQEGITRRSRSSSCLQSSTPRPLAHFILSCGEHYSKAGCLPPEKGLHPDPWTAPGSSAGWALGGHGC